MSHIKRETRTGTRAQKEGRGLFEGEPRRGVSSHIYTRGLWHRGSRHRRETQTVRRGAAPTRQCWWRWRRRRVEKGKEEDRGSEANAFGGDLHRYERERRDAGWVRRGGNVGKGWEWGSGQKGARGKMMWDSEGL